METLIEPALTRMLLVGVRVSLVVIFLPFLGSGGIPARIKAALTMVLTAMIAAVYTPPTSVLANINWLSVFIGEAIVGLALGLSVQFVFEAVGAAGQLCGLQLGYSLESLIDPMTQAQSPVLSTLFSMVATLIFLRLNVHHWLLRALTESFECAPPGHVVAHPEIVRSLMRDSGLILSVGVQIATPIIVAALMIDIALGLIGRAASQLPVMLVGISIKNLVGMAILGTTLAFWPGELEGLFTGAIRSGEHLIRLAH